MDALTYGLAEIMRGFIFGNEKQIIICGAGWFIVKMMSPSAKSKIFLLNGEINTTPLLEGVNNKQN